MRKVVVFLIVFLFLFISGFWLIILSDKTANIDAIVNIRIGYEEMLAKIAKTNGVLRKLIESTSPSKIMVKGVRGDNGNYLYRLNELKFVSLNKQDQLLIGSFQDSKGNIYRIKLVNLDPSARNSEHVLDLIDYDLATDFSAIVSFDAYLDELSSLENLTNIFRRGKYFNVYWEDGRTLSEINRFYSSPEYNPNETKPINILRLVMFR